MFEERNVDSILSLMGGTIFHFIVGVKTMWGIVTPYITSYLVQFDPSVNYHRTLHVYTAVFLGQALFMYLGGRLEKIIGARPLSYLGATLISSCTYLSSYSKSILSLVSLQALVGVGIGLSYSAPIICTLGHYKKNKGIVTGIITTGTGAGPFLAGLVATTYVNRENYPVDSSTGLYDPDSSPVVGRVPGMFRVLGIMYAICGFVGASLLVSPSDDDRDHGEEKQERVLESLAAIKAENGERAPLLDQKDQGGCCSASSLGLSKPSSSGGSGRGHQRYGSRHKFTATYELTTTQMIRDSLCWLVIVAAICTAVPGFFITSTYKNFGQTFISDDHFITVVGCLGCLVSGLSRMGWGSMADRLGHFETLELAAYLSPLVFSIYALIARGKAAFGLCVLALYGLWGASYCLVPAVVAFLFGEKHLGQNYGFVFFVFGVCCTIIIDGAGSTGWDFKHLNLAFVTIGLVGAALCSRIRYLTSKVKDETVLRHHRATSSVSSML